MEPTVIGPAIWKLPGASVMKRAKLPETLGAF
jgi:hypothetical protein